MRNKVDLLVDQINGNLDVLAISETKLNDSCLAEQFEIPSYASLFRLDRNQSAGGIFAFVREDIPVKILIGDFNTRIDNR